MLYGEKPALSGALPSCPSRLIASSLVAHTASAGLGAGVEVGPAAVVGVGAEHVAAVEGTVVVGVPVAVGVRVVVGDAGHITAAHPGGGGQLAPVLAVPG